LRTRLRTARANCRNYLARKAMGCSALEYSCPKCRLEYCRICKLLPFARDAVNIWFLHRGCIFSEPYSPPHLFPCLRFALHLAVPDKTRGRADRYSLLVGILHSLLHAGLSRRTAIFHQLRRYGPEVPFAVRYGLIPSNLRSAISGPAGGTICWHGLSTEGAWG
jgi:hypothetical protein